MVIRLLRGVLRLNPLHLAMVVLSTAMGSSIAASLGTTTLQVGDRIAHELRSFGANIVVEPAAATAPSGARVSPGHLNEADLQRILTIFWRHNIVGLAPSLTAPATFSRGGVSERALLAGVWFDRRLPLPGQSGKLRAGVASMFPFWELEGRWPGPAQEVEAAVGRALASRLHLGVGDSVTMLAGGKTQVLRVVGLVRSGGFEDDGVMVDLEAAQRFLELPGRVSRALVSVVTVPLDTFGRRDPAGMTKREFEKWFCTPYVTSVARQIESTVPGSRARPVWSMAEAEARVLSRLSILMVLLAAITLAAAALAVASTFAARVMARRAEIALMRACGASTAHVVLLLGAEVAMLAAAGGVTGTLLAAFMVRGLGTAVFGTPLALSPMLVPLALGGSMLAGAAGAIWPLRRALEVDPAVDLKEAG
ncbi:MAG: FtsX-like permease family protein [Deltaproteobacteria bacterium]|nr:FtsX-like permease family protein [Deltaproteobacteria bacterium]